jgi:hypothetical protein
MEGRLSSRILAGQNALAYVLFDSATNQTEEDNKKTLEMLQILLDKKLDPNAIAGQVFWVKDKPEDEGALDYVGTYSLVWAAIEYSFPEALELLLKNGARYSPYLLEVFAKVKDKLPHAQEFEKILQQYESQKMSQEEFEKRIEETNAMIL